MRNHPLTINQEGFWNLKELELETELEVRLPRANTEAQAFAFRGKWSV
jgi:hypothetical protein